MGNVLEFFVKMKDMMSTGLAKVAQNAKKSFTEVEVAVERVKTHMGRLRNEVDSVDASARKSSFFNGSMFRNLAGIIGTVGIMAFAKDSVSKAMDFGATKMSFEVLTGDKTKGNAMADQLNKLQQDTILGPEVFKNAQTMLGFGIAADKVLPTMKMLGDISMGDAQKLDSLTLAFSQVQSAGKLQGQDLLQLINAGYNPLKDIAAMTGKTMAQMKDEMQKGAISSDMVTKAFERATGKGGLFNHMMDRMGETSFGRMKILEGAFENLKIQTGQTLMPLAEGLMKVATYLIDHIELVVAAGAAWGVYKLATIEATTFQELLNVAMSANPIGLIIAAIAALVVWIGFAIKKYQGWSDAMRGVELMSDGFLKSMGGMWKDVYQGIDYYISMSLLKIEQLGLGITSASGMVGVVMKDVASGRLANIKDDMARFVANSGFGEATKEIERRKKQWAADHGNNLTEIGYGNHLSEHGMSKVATAWKNGLMTPKKDTSVSAAGAAGSGGSNTKVSDLVDDKSGAGKAMAGGPRVIKINGVKFTDKIELHVASAKESADELQRIFEEMFLRVLNSGASVQ